MKKSIEIIYKTSDSVEFEVLQLVREFFESMVNSDISMFNRIWNPEAKIFSLGNSNKLQIDDLNLIIQHRLIGLKKAKEEIPNFDVDFHISDVLKISIYDLIAVVDVKWEMILPNSKGNHFSSFHIVKSESKWEIVSFLDRGIELET